MSSGNKKHNQQLGKKNQLKEKIEFEKVISEVGSGESLPSTTLLHWIIYLISGISVALVGPLNIFQTPMFDLDINSGSNLVISLSVGFISAFLLMFTYQTFAVKKRKSIFASR